MKSDGLRLEDSQLETADGLMKLTAIAAKAACVVLQLVQARDGAAQPASVAFSPTEIAVLDALNAKIEGKTKKQKNPHPHHGLSWASWIIARMGGWNNRHRMGKRCLHAVARKRGRKSSTGITEIREWPQRLLLLGDTRATMREAGAAGRRSARGAGRAS